MSESSGTSMSNAGSIERWLPVVDYEGYYEVSDQGSVRRCARRTRNGQGEYILKPRLLKPNIEGSGYPSVSIKKLVNGVQYGSGRHRVHSLVMTAFVGPRPDGMEVCHNDGDKTNNRLSNLRYDSHSENALDIVRHGNSKWANKTHCPQGHEYTPENTRISVRRSGPHAGQSFRSCITCSREAARASYARKRGDAS